MWIKREAEDLEELALLDGPLGFFVPVGIELDSALLKEPRRVVLSVVESLEVEGARVERCCPERADHGEGGQERALRSVARAAIRKRRAMRHSGAALCMDS